MIRFVLDDPREQTVSFKRKRLTVFIERLHRNAHGTAYGFIHARYRQTTFFVIADFFRRRNDLRVYKNTLYIVVGDGDKETQFFSDLRSRKSDAVRIDHRFKHVADERFNFIRHFSDRHRFFAQHFFSEFINPYHIALRKSIYRRVRRKHGIIRCCLPNSPFDQLSLISSF